MSNFKKNKSIEDFKKIPPKGSVLERFPDKDKQHTNEDI